MSTEKIKYMPVSKPNLKFFRVGVLRFLFLQSHGPLYPEPLLRLLPASHRESLTVLLHLPCAARMCLKAFKTKKYNLLTSAIPSPAIAPCFAYIRHKIMFIELNKSRVFIRHISLFDKYASNCARSYWGNRAGIRTLVLHGHY